MRMDTMGMGSASGIVLVLFALVAPTLADSIYCEGGVVCHGHNPYCCLLDSGDIGCCWNTYVYQLWWFWLLWVIVFFLILACSTACWRRRQRNFRYVVMANSEYPTYGTVVHTSSTVNTGAYPGGIAQPPSAPVAPPSYASKPPPYSG